MDPVEKGQDEAVGRFQQPVVGTLNSIPVVASPRIVSVVNRYFEIDGVYIPIPDGVEFIRPDGKTTPLFDPP
jgi:hypothetical protein